MSNLFAIAVVPIFVAVIVLYGAIKKVNVYDEFIEGAKGGLKITADILPYVVGMIFAVDIFKASGCFEWMSETLSPIFSAVNIPTALLPLALMRPFSGGASVGVLGSIFAAYGPDSYVGRVASTMMGSSETMFYTIALYCGSVGVTKTRYIVPVGIFTDIVGIIASCMVCLYYFGT